MGFRVWARFVCDVCCHTSSVGEEGSEGLASDDGIVVVAGHLLWGLYAVSVCARGGGGVVWGGQGLLLKQFMVSLAGLVVKRRSSFIGPC